MKQYFMTLGSGQPYYPGYFIAYARDDDELTELCDLVDRAIGGKL